MSKNLILSVVCSISLLMASGCAITRYYKVPDVDRQIGVMNGQIDAGVAKMNADYDSKKTLLDGAKKSGANLGNPPFSSLSSLLKQMAADRDAATAKANDARAESTALSKSIAGRQRVMSNEPEYDKVSGFQKRSETLNQDLNQVFTHYTDHSNEFVKTANENKIFPIDVAQFNGQLRTAIGDIDRQCSQVESKIQEYETKIRSSQVSKREERIGLLEQMRGDVKTIQDTKGDLTSFQKNFESEVKGRKTFVVGPHLPHADLFQTFSGVQDKVNQAVTRFNAKVAAFNALK